MSTPIYEGTTPLVTDRYIITATAGEDLLIGQVVEITADWTAKKATSNPSAKHVGITLTAALNGKKVSIVCRGLARATAYGTITAGDSVGSAVDGKVQTIAVVTATDCNTSAGTAIAINNTRAILGVALAGAASGGTAYILVW
jgi:hypothetical protein